MPHGMQHRAGAAGAHIGRSVALTQHLPHRSGRESTLAVCWALRVTGLWGCPALDPVLSHLPAMLSLLWLPEGGWRARGTLPEP